MDKPEKPILIIGNNVESIFELTKIFARNSLKVEVVCGKDATRQQLLTKTKTTDNADKIKISEICADKFENLTKIIDALKSLNIQSIYIFGEGEMKSKIEFNEDKINTNFFLTIIAPYLIARACQPRIFNFILNSKTIKQKVPMPTPGRILKLEHEAPSSNTEKTDGHVKVIF